MTKILKKKETFVFIIFLIFASSPVFGQIDLGKAVNTVTSLAAQVAAVLGGVVGLYGIGRSAYQFASGGDGVTSLITGIVGYVLANVASTLL